MPTYRLDNWSGIAMNSYYGPDLSGNLRLHGSVSGHPRFSDGEEVTTSIITTFQDNVVMTVSGSSYELGQVDPTYVTWLKEHKILFDPAQPLRWVRL